MPTCGAVEKSNGAGKTPRFKILDFCPQPQLHRSVRLTPAQNFFSEFSPETLDLVCRHVDTTGVSSLHSESEVEIFMIFSCRCLSRLTPAQKFFSELSPETLDLVCRHVDTTGVSSLHSESEVEIFKFCMSMPPTIIDAHDSLRVCLP